MTPKCTLQLQSLRCLVHLGATSEEREKPQEVDVDFSISFAEPPVACLTDALSDTICYGELSNSIRKVCTMKHYKLIEHLTYSIHHELRPLIPMQSALRVKVTKLNPPIDKLYGGARFTYED